MREEDRLSGMGLPRCKVEIIVFKYMHVTCSVLVTLLQVQ